MEQLKTPETHDVRGQLRDDDEAVYLMDHPDSDEEIPTLDISAYLDGRSGGLEAAAAQLRQISTTIGFFYLKGHGIPQALLDRLFAESRRFHALPNEIKSKIPYFTTVSGFKSGYHSYAGDGFQNQNVNIISDGKPNLVA